jgi:hypothetical protein
MTTLRSETDPEYPIRMSAPVIEQPQEWTPEYVENLLGINIAHGVVRIANAHNGALAAERERIKTLAEVLEEFENEYPHVTRLLAKVEEGTSEPMSNEAQPQRSEGHSALRARKLEKFDPHPTSEQPQEAERPSLGDEWTEKRLREYVSDHSVYLQRLAKDINAALAVVGPKLRQNLLDVCKERDDIQSELAAERKRIKSLEQLIITLPAQADLDAEREKRKPIVEALERIIWLPQGQYITPVLREIRDIACDALAKVKE